MSDELSNVDGQEHEWAEASRGRNRAHQRSGRVQRVYLRLSQAEHAAVAEAASKLGMSVAGFCTEAALGAVETGQIQGTEATREQLRELMAELFAARVAVNRFGTNVNQAVAALHSTGQPPVWLADAVGLCSRAVDRVDEVCGRISRMLPRVRQRLWRT